MSLEIFIKMCNRGNTMLSETNVSREENEAYENAKLAFISYMDGMYEYSPAFKE